jgi:hypothetical protein
MAFVRPSGIWRKQSSRTIIVRPGSCRNGEQLACRQFDSRIRSEIARGVCAGRATFRSWELARVCFNLDEFPVCGPIIYVFVRVVSGDGILCFSFSRACDHGEHASRQFFPGPFDVRQFAFRVHEREHGVLFKVWNALWLADGRSEFQPRFIWNAGEYGKSSQFWDSFRVALV